MENFLNQNFYLIYFVYGLVFFVMGYTVAIQARNYSSFSFFPLAKKLWMLAAFGISHGLSEWAMLFLPIHAGYVSGDFMPWLINLQQLVIAVSYLFLYHFGLAVINPSNRFIKQLPNLFFMVWIFSYIYFRFIDTMSQVWLISAAETWSRYLLALPASGLCSFAMVLQWRTMKNSTHKYIAGKFLVAGVLFGVYAVFAGLVVPSAEFLPASMINKQSFQQVFGVPVEILRALSGMAMVYYVIGGLEVFRVENARAIEEGKRFKSIYQERGRISRDLHDGIIQSIYVVGLHLENTLFLLKDNRKEAERQVAESMERLNDVIKDIRKYIMKLTPANFSEGDLVIGVSNLMTNYQDTYGIFIDLEVTGQQSFELNEEQRTDFYHIIQEAFTNVTKHSRASYVKVALVFSQDSFSCSVHDNGHGFDVNNQLNSLGEGRGLNNMFMRAENMAAKLEVKSAYGLGTWVSLACTKGGVQF
ncbi:MAG: histidine kinase [Thermincola sp.]|nr:histidine kinase [Thermincola sp.]MDT3703084.1 histidine kinase [Thermincola sp.]